MQLLRSGKELMKMLCSLARTHTERVCIRHQDMEGVAYQWEGGFPLSLENRNSVLLDAGMLKEERWGETKKG